MKKIFTVITIMLISLMAFTGCNSLKGDDTTTSTGLNTSFTCKADIKCGETESTATVQRIGKGAWDILFETPNSLAGVKLSFLDDTATASYKGLSFSIPKSALPLKSVFLNLITVVDEYAEKQEIQGKEKDGNIIIKGEIEQGDYILTLNDKGELLAFEMSNWELSMTFSDFKAGGTIPEETTISNVETTPAETTVTTPAS